MSVCRDNNLSIITRLVTVGILSNTGKFLSLLPRGHTFPLSNYLERCRASGTCNEDEQKVLETGHRFSRVAFKFLTSGPTLDALSKILSQPEGNELIKHFVYQMLSVADEDTLPSGYRASDDGKVGQWKYLAMYLFTWLGELENDGVSVDTILNRLAALLDRLKPEDLKILTSMIRSDLKDNPIRSLLVQPKFAEAVFEYHAAFRALPSDHVYKKAVYSTFNQVLEDLPEMVDAGLGIARTGYDPDPRKRQEYWATFQSASDLFLTPKVSFPATAKSGVRTFSQWMADASEEDAEKLRLHTASLLPKKTVHHLFDAIDRDQRIAGTPEKAALPDLLNEFGVMATQDSLWQTFRDLHLMETASGR
jgi:hypothetical protein